MAIGSSVITGTRQTAWAADKVCMLGYDTTISSAKWCVAGTSASADETDALYPVGSLQDGLLSVDTRPDEAKETWYLYITLTDAITMDALYLFVTDIDSADDISVELAGTGDADFASALTIDNITEADFTGTNDRLFFPQLQLSGDGATERRAFTDVKYIRIKFTYTGDTCIPKVSELIVGEQCNMIANPLYPYNAYQRASAYTNWQSETMVISRSVLASQLKQVRADLVWNNATDLQYFLDIVTVCEGGSKPFVWCDTPQSDPNTAYLMFSDFQDFVIDREHYGRWNYQLEAVEQGDNRIGV